MTITYSTATREVAISIILGITGLSCSQLRCLHRVCIIVVLLLLDLLISAVPVYEQMFLINPKVAQALSDTGKTKMLTTILTSVTSVSEITKKWTSNVE